MAAQPLAMGLPIPLDQRPLQPGQCGVCGINVFSQGSTADLVVPSAATPSNPYQPVCGCVAHLECMKYFMGASLQAQKQHGLVNPVVWCPFPNCRRVFTGLARLPRREGVSPPKLTGDRNSLEAFYRFWDKDGNGSLDMNEVYGALVITFNIKEPRRQAEVIKYLNDVWGIFDKDRDTTISREEFIRNDGLGQSIVANLRFSQ